jgi:hypothetical protein
VFDIDITVCEACGGRVRIIACIEDPAVIRRILKHLERTLPAHTAQPHIPRGPPQLSLPGFKD